MTAVSTVTCRLGAAAVEAFPDMNPKQSGQVTALGSETMQRVLPSSGYETSSYNNDNHNKTRFYTGAGVYVTHAPSSVNARSRPVGWR